MPNQVLTFFSHCLIYRPQPVSTCIVAYVLSGSHQILAVLILILLLSFLLTDLVFILFRGAGKDNPHKKSLDNILLSNLEP